MLDLGGSPYLDVQRLAKTIQSFRTLGYHVECLALLSLFSAQCIQLSYQDFALKVGLITKEVVEVCNCQVTGFKSQDSKRRETIAKHLEKRV